MTFASPHRHLSRCSILCLIVPGLTALPSFALASLCRCLHSEIILLVHLCHEGYWQIVKTDWLSKIQTYWSHPEKKPHIKCPYILHCKVAAHWDKKSMEPLFLPSSWTLRYILFYFFFVVNSSFYPSSHPLASSSSQQLGMTVPSFIRLEFHSPETTSLPISAVHGTVQKCWWAVIIPQLHFLDVSSLELLASVSTIVEPLTLCDSHPRVSSLNPSQDKMPPSFRSAYAGGYSDEIKKR